MNVAIAPDGKWLVSGGEDKRLILWDAATLREIRSLNLDDSVEALAVSPSGDWIGASVKGHPLFVRVADFLQVPGSEKNSEPGSIFFLPGGEQAVSIDALGGQIRVWDVVTGKQLRTAGDRLLPGEWDCCIHSAALSHDGKTLVVLALQNGQGSLIAVDVASGTRQSVAQGLPLKADGVAWDKIAFASDDRSVLLTSRGLHQIPLQTGSKVRDWAGKTFLQAAVSLSPTKLVLINLSGLAVCDLAACDQPAIHPARGAPLSLAVSNDGSFAIVGSDNGTLARWNLSTLTVAAESEALPRMRDLQFSPDGQLLAAASTAEMYRVWDLEAGQPLERRRDTSPEGDRTADTGAWLRFTGNRELLVFGKRKGLLYRLQSTADPRLVTDQVTSQMMLFDRQAYALSAGMGKVAFVDDQGALHVADLSGGNNVVVQAGPDASATEQMSFSPDGHLLAVSSSSGFNLWDWQAKKTTLSLQLDSRSSAFSPDGKLIAVGGCPYPLFVTLFEVATAHPVAIFQIRESFASPAAIAFNHDGTKVAVASDSNDIYLWDVPSALRGDILAKLGANNMEALMDIVNSNKPVLLHAPVPGTSTLVFSPDDRWLASGSRDGAIRVWNWREARLAATLLSGPNLFDWLVYTPDGHFDGSPSMWSAVSWRLSAQTFQVLSAESAFRRLYRPGLLALVLSGRTLPKIDLAGVNPDAPVVHLTRNDGPVDDVPIDSRYVRLRLEVADPAHAGIQDLRLFRNGKLVRIWRGPQQPGNYEATVPLVVGRNGFTASAYSSQQVKSPDDAIALEGSSDLRRRGVAYVIAIGIDQYSDPSLTLRYAGADAHFVGSALTARLKDLGAWREVRQIEIVDAAATHDNLLNALRCLTWDAAGECPAPFSGLFRAEPEDGVFIYYAGHGLSWNQHFYFLPHDVSVRFQQLAEETSITLSHAISDVELQSVLERIDAGTFMLVIDACNSGQILQAVDPRQGPLDTPGLGQLAYDKDMYVLTASQAYQAALESSREQHGLLTWALIQEGLEQKNADFAPKNGEITIDEWFRYAAQRVPALRGEDAAAGRGIISGSAPSSPQVPRFFLRNDLSLEPVLIARDTAPNN